VTDVTVDPDEQREPASAARPGVDLTLGGMGVAELLGGPRGVVESAIPGVLFATVYGLNGQDLASALWAALAVGALVMVVSLVQRRPVRQAVGGFVGVAIMAAVSRYTGRAEDFYLPSVLKNAGWALAYTASIVVRWPLLGVFLGPMLGEGFSWRKDPRRLRAYAIASWFWVGMFALRFAIQLPLYLAGAVTALGFVNIPLGLPLFAFTCWLSYLVIRRVPVARTAEELAAEDEQEDAAR
jgi:hypothetical protein